MPFLSSPLAALLLAVQAPAQPPAPAAPGVVIPEGRALHDAIAARSADYFMLYHEGCDPERLRAMLLPQFEMYHDQNGVVARGPDRFVARYATRCAARGKPGANRLRRELVPGTLKVYPVPGYGAIEEGRHDHYGSVGGRPERKVSTARYLHLWALTPDGWRVARVFSYDHHDAPRLPPIRPPGTAADAPPKPAQ